MLSLNTQTAIPLTDMFSFSPLNLTGSYKAKGRHACKTERGAGGPDSLHLSQGNSEESYRKVRKSRRRGRKQLQFYQSTQQEEYP